MPDSVDKQLAPGIENRTVATDKSWYYLHFDLHYRYSGTMSSAEDPHGAMVLKTR
jgi:hypothetical protein